MKFSSLALVLLASLGATVSGSDFDCKLPDDADQYSIATLEDAAIGAHNMYKGMCVTGALTDTTPNESAAIDNTMSYIGSETNTFNTGWNGGVEYGAVSSRCADMWEHLEYLATHAQSSNEGGKKVVVVTECGEYNMYDFNNGGQGYDKGNTLVIFNCAGDITLDKTNDGRQFGPSVLAPFATVYVKGDAGFVDGTIWAKSIETTGGNDGALQLHGDTYDGPIDCGGEPGTKPPTKAPSEPNPTSPAPTEAPNKAPPTGGGDGDCKVSIESQSAWHAGVKVGFDSDSQVLDFSNTGLDLDTVNFSQGEFTGEVIGQTIKLTKPAYISSTNLGGFQLAPKQGPNEALATFTVPECGGGGDPTTEAPPDTTEEPDNTTEAPPDTTEEPDDPTDAPPITTAAPPTGSTSGDPQ